MLSNTKLLCRSYKKSKNCILVPFFDSNNVVLKSKFKMTHNRQQKFYETFKLTYCFTLNSPIQISGIFDLFILG